MSELRTTEPANPEGKGVNELLLDINQSRPTGSVAKPGSQIIADMFTSMLILSSGFKYKPLVGAANYLYRVRDEWSLSLIAPGEWSSSRRAGFVGICLLQNDMTWTIAPSTQLSQNNRTSDALRRFYNAFVKSLNTDLTLEEVLPFYVDKLPYYPRLYANALSHSIFTSIVLGEQTATCCRDWGALTPPANTHLPALAAMNIRE